MARVNTSLVEGFFAGEDGGIIEFDTIGPPAAFFDPRNALQELFGKAQSFQTWSQPLIEFC
ncbi:hypothetical protein JOE62_001311 [Glutamicibacter nicotianae]|nr:hypothetical protein [Glutamicibacter nicotianae]